ncbi:hypothetical protein BG015_006706 [Linnemannia schmuckeri]|uniref:NAD(P)-binding domain-containing protein n=1 Tax=Linnemannia schmuckeri TaxID=64567 RepID=A0A9P5S065_9FUNG|nr:hypothetical protein BG015_006706 [Linnemannia schmuckeri]
MSHILPSSHVKKVAITNVDSWLGCWIAVHLAEKLEKKCPNVHIVALACKDNTHADLDKLKKFKNVHIHKVDYNDERCLEKALSGVRCSILLPEMTEHRVKHAKNVLCAMKKEKVKGCLLLSVAGAENKEHNLKEIMTFHEIEQMVEEYCSCYLILRKSILNQCFLLWSPTVQEKGEFPMSCTAECHMAPLDACDLACAIETVVVEHCNDDDKGGHRDAEAAMNEESTDDDHSNFGGVHKNKKYTLTGPRKITAQGLVQALNEETGQRVQFKQVSREELKKYFESLKKREDWPENLSIDRCNEVLSEGALAAEGGDHPHMAPNESMINLLLDELELIKKGDAGFVSGDLEKILGHQGKSVKDFLRKYKDEFRHQR